MSEASEGYYALEREEMFRYVPPTTRRMLDVGCAQGRFAQLVKERLGAQAWGIELNPEAARVAAARLDRVISADVQGALPGLPEAFFDCVVFNDVLEHLVDPYSVLRDVKRHLAPGGVVVASIPNVRYHRVIYDLLVRGDWDYADWGVLDRTHLRFFTRNSIRKMFTRLGYRLVRLEPLSATALGRAVSRLLPRRFRDLPYMQFACVAEPAPTPPA